MMDGGVPATPAAFAKTDQPRVAKPNEVSYSQNWSPLINTTGTVARGGRTKRGAAAQVRPFYIVHTVFGYKFNRQIFVAAPFESNFYIVNFV